MFPFKIYHILIFLLLTRSATSAKILGIFPFTAKSHYIMYETLMLALHSRGHEITVLSHFPQKVPLKNFIDISLEGATTSLSKLSLGNIKTTPYSLYKNLYKLYKEIDDYEPLFKLPKVRELISLCASGSAPKFDLIITELFNTDMFLSFVYMFDAPFIALSACPLMPWAHERFSNPDNPSYVPMVFTQYHDKMDFFERVSNFIGLLVSKAVYTYLMNVKSQSVANKYFPGIPLLKKIAKNTSLILVNTHFSLHKPMPLSQRVIQVGGMHIREAKPLNKDLESFINGAKCGVVLFSLGSMFRADTLSDEKRIPFERAFARLPQRIIWKWEGEIINNSDKIFYMKWLPQRDILAHKNVRLFIYHGGLMGTTEAVHCGVPILGIPMYGDMPVNMAAVVSAGAGLTLSLQEISEDTVYAAVHEIINNPSYKYEAMKLSERFRDRPRPPLDEAVYWTEYVIRHQGAPHLVSQASQLAWYQYYLLDVILCIVTIPVILSILVYFNLSLIFSANV